MCHVKIWHECLSSIHSFSLLCLIDRWIESIGKGEYRLEDAPSIALLKQLCGKYHHHSFRGDYSIYLFSREAGFLIHFEVKRMKGKHFYAFPWLPIFQTGCLLPHCLYTWAVFGTFTTWAKFSLSVCTFLHVLLWDSGFGVLRSRGGIWLQNKLQWMWQDTFLCSCNIAHESLFYRFLEEDCWKCISMFVLLPFLLVLLFANSGKFLAVIKVSTWMKMSSSKSAN